MRMNLLPLLTPDTTYNVKLTEFHGDTRLVAEMHTILNNSIYAQNTANFDEVERLIQHVAQHLVQHDFRYVFAIIPWVRQLAYTQEATLRDTMVIDLLKTLDVIESQYVERYSQPIKSSLVVDPVAFNVSQYVKFSLLEDVNTLISKGITGKALAELLPVEHQTFSELDKNIYVEAQHLCITYDETNDSNVLKKALALVVYLNRQE